MACKCGRAHSVVSVLVLMALAIAAVSSTKYPRILPPHDPLAMNASEALREAGYHIMATAFELFAAEFIPLGPVTFFAISDQALLNSRLPPWVMMKLLRYHTITEMLLRDDLHILTSGICIRTVLSHKSLIVTHEQTENSTVALNNVEISDTNIFAAVGAYRCSATTGAPEWMPVLLHGHEFTGPMIQGSAMDRRMQWM
ncbi:hypothetical protein SUGI_0385270 [Cryptomeria japonica]|nr:hypothetical protein SUGI_0385270 [Cryptomeria japonica]